MKRKMKKEDRNQREENENSVIPVSLFGLFLLVSFIFYSFLFLQQYQAKQIEINCANFLNIGYK